MNLRLSVSSLGVVQKHPAPSPDFINRISRIRFRGLAISTTCSSDSSMYSTSMLRGSLCNNSALDRSIWGRNCRTLASTNIIKCWPVRCRRVDDRVAHIQPVAPWQTSCARQNQRRGLEALPLKSLLRLIVQEYLLMAKDDGEEH